MKSMLHLFGRLFSAIVTRSPVFSNVQAQCYGVYREFVDAFTRLERKVDELERAHARQLLSQVQIPHINEERAKESGSWNPVCVEQRTDIGDACSDVSNAALTSEVTGGFQRPTPNWRLPGGVSADEPKILQYDAEMWVQIVDQDVIYFHRSALRRVLAWVRHRRDVKSLIDSISHLRANSLLFVGVTDPVLVSLLAAVGGWAEVRFVDSAPEIVQAARVAFECTVVACESLRDGEWITWARGEASAGMGDGVSQRRNLVVAEFSGRDELLKKVDIVTAQRSYNTCSVFIPSSAYSEEAGAGWDGFVRLFVEDLHRRSLVCATFNPFERVWQPFVAASWSRQVTPILEGPYEDLRSAGLVMADGG